ncbi:MAG: hypothetical protein FWF77_02020 [Defluviitaleaceae bacterium]|nr:hypothetical protein [Defluviitaleaceae bacterium]
MLAEKTIPDTVLRKEGMRKLNEWFGLVNAERFITLIIREPFDYTEWQRDLYTDLTADELFEKANATWQRNQFEGMSIEEISKEAVEYCKANPR